MMGYPLMNVRDAFPRFLLVVGLLAVSVVQADEDIQDSVTAMEVNAAKEYVVQHEDAVIIDVRMPVEYEMSHITGAVNVDVQDETFERMASALDPNKTYIVHCTKNPVGGRSSRALETLQRLGFKHLYSLEGGYIAWKDAELPLTELDN
jgi:rhodanese-related sulfurtransferase